MYVVDPVLLKRKRQKFAGDPNAHLLRHLQAPMQDIASKFFLTSSWVDGSLLCYIMPFSNTYISVLVISQSTNHDNFLFISFY